MRPDVIIYEQPLNEHSRACLRLEHLFEQFHQTAIMDSQWASRFAVQSLIKILNVVDRPDIKAKLTKALSDHASVLTQLEKSPQVDSTKLREFLDQLDNVVDQLYALPGKIGQKLTENDFLGNVRAHMNNPGGPCNFSIPSYQLWLQQSAEHRNRDLRLWYKEFALLDQAVRLLLQLTREFTRPGNCNAELGFYQQALDPNLQGELVRVMLNVEDNLFPEISVGRHRLAIRFYHNNLLDKPKQTANTVKFKLLYCAI